MSGEDPSRPYASASSIFRSKIEDHNLLNWNGVNRGCASLRTETLDTHSSNTLQHVCCAMQWDLAEPWGISLRHVPRTWFVNTVLRAAAPIARLPLASLKQT